MYIKIPSVTYCLLLHATLALAATKSLCCDKASRTTYTVKEDGSPIYKTKILPSNLNGVAESAANAIIGLSTPKWGVKINVYGSSGTLEGNEKTHEDCCKNKVMQFKEWEDAIVKLNLGGGSIDVNCTATDEIHPWLGHANAYLTLECGSDSARLIYFEDCTKNGGIGSASFTQDFLNIPATATVGVRVTAAAGWRFAKLATTVDASLSFATTAVFLTECPSGNTPTVNFLRLSDSSLYLNISGEVYIKIIGDDNEYELWGNATSIKLI